VAEYTEAYKDLTKQAKEGLKWMIVNTRTEGQTIKSFGKEFDTVYYRYQETMLDDQPAPLPEFVQTDAQIKYGAQLQSHVAAYTVKAITGAVKIDETWDQYVKDYLALGGKDVIAEMRQLYEKLNK